MSSRARQSAFVIVLACGMAVGGVAAAQPPDRGSTDKPAEPQTAAQREAAQHFQRARELYLKGSYRDALGELEIAHKLDPVAKDLVFNLGVVNEKLVNIEDAIRWFKKYSEMDLTAAERDKAEMVLKRLEGARQELEEKRRRDQQQQQQQQRTPPPAAPAEKPREMGRIDGLTIGAASVGAACLVLGIVFAAKASSDRPQGGFVTGRDGSYEDLRSQADSAHGSAIVADIGFALGAVGTVGAALLYFLRPKDDDSAQRAGKARLSAAPVPGGGAMVLRGTF